MGRTGYQECHPKPEGRRLMRLPSRRQRDELTSDLRKMGNPVGIGDTRQSSMKGDNQCGQNSSCCANDDDDPSTKKLEER